MSLQKGKRSQFRAYQSETISYSSNILSYLNIVNVIPGANLFSREYRAVFETDICSEKLPGGEREFP